MRNEIQNRTLFAVVLAAAVTTSVDGQSTGSSYAANRDRLKSLSVEQRRKVVERYAEFLALPLEKREQIYRLDKAIQAQSPDQRTRYYQLMDRYFRWKQQLPSFQQKTLSEASPSDLGRLVSQFRREELDSRRVIRPYWFVPERVGPRRQALTELVRDRISETDLGELDLMYPTDRYERLRQLGFQHNLYVGGGPRDGRRPPGGFPQVEREKIIDFIRSMPEDRRNELRDLNGPAFLRRAAEIYYELNPRELDRLKARPGPAEPRNNGLDPRQK